MNSIEKSISECKNNPTKYLSSQGQSKKQEKVQDIKQPEENSISVAFHLLMTNDEVRQEFSWISADNRV